MKGRWSAARWLIFLSLCGATLAAGQAPTGVQSSAAVLDRSKIESVLKEADALVARGASADALPLLQPLLTEPLSQDPALEANVYYSLGRAYDRLSRLPEALTHYQRSLDGYRAVGNKRFEARSLRIIAQVHKNTGTYEQGIALGQQALALYTELGERRDIALTYVVLGATYDSEGDHRKALESFQRALPLLSVEKNHDLVNVLNEIGITQKNLGNYADALRTYQQAFELAREINDLDSAGFLSLNLAVLESTLGEVDRALEHSQEALRLARAAADRRGEAIALENLAETYWMLGNRPRALETMQTMLGVAREMGTRNQEALILKNLGDMNAEIGELATARQRYDEALAIQREIGERKSVASTLVALADLTLRQGKTDESLRSAREGLAVVREIERPELEWTARRAVAQAEAASGANARAIDELRASVRIINDLRANVASDMSKVSFVDRRQDVFGDLAALLVASGRIDEALEIAEAGRARAFADLLKQRQILGKAKDRDALARVRKEQDDYERALSAAPVLTAAALPAAANGLRGGERLVNSVAAFSAEHRELASLLTAESPTIADIRTTIGRLRATLVEYLVTETQTLAWVIGADGVTHSATINATRTQLEQLVTTVRQGIDAAVTTSTGRRTATPRAPLRELDRLIVAPLSQWLPSSPDAPVVIVPHGPLAVVPFAALEDATGRPLIARHVLAFAPAVSVFAYTSGKTLPATERLQDALVVADPTPPAGSGLERLPYAREEGQRVAARLGARRARLLIGSDATEQRVKQDASSYSILHFATHGLVAPERPLASSLTLASGSEDDGYLRVDEIFNLDLSADLVVLSGCSTGLGKLTGDGIVGLTRAFLYAGTPTVVVSQWNVSDRATAQLMDRFYLELGRGRTKGQALRAAALHVRTTLADPAFWAPFQLVGEP